MPSPVPDVTTLLGLANQGDESAKEALYRLVEGELRKRARARLRQEQSPHLLQTTMLVDDAFLKLVGGSNLTWTNRSQFYCLAAKVMRQILVDEARHRTATKRGGGDAAVPLHAVPEPADRTGPDPVSLLALHEAMTRLAETRPELSEVVELHHFGGWDLKQIADEVLRVPYPTIKRRWKLAQSLLFRVLSGGDDDTGV
jgi:RNA polymerase sigma-70 factor (ECF subfamily)